MKGKVNHVAREPQPAAEQRQSCRWLAEHNDPELCVCWGGGVTKRELSNSVADIQFFDHWTQKVVLPDDKTLLAMSLLNQVSSDTLDKNLSTTTPVHANITLSQSWSSNAAPLCAKLPRRATHITRPDNSYPVHISVRGASELSAALDEHLVRPRDGLHAVAVAVEEDAHVGLLRAARPHLLPCLRLFARVQGTVQPFIRVQCVRVCVCVCVACCWSQESGKFLEHFCSTDHSSARY